MLSSQDSQSFTSSENLFFFSFLLFFLFLSDFYDKVFGDLFLQCRGWGCICLCLSFRMCSILLLLEDFPVQGQNLPVGTNKLIDLF